ncbi:MAG TPA: biotin/lipoyl-binding protein, partial [Gemmatimonadaceae bacterium]|nr:biotin/lipoyl-binding protein [Gemmatimonadaceae bacterium]
MTRALSVLRVQAVTSAIVVGAACYGAAASQSDTRPPVTVPVVPVNRVALSNDLVLTAEFTPYQEVDVMAKVAGYIKIIRVDIGDHVRAGELLAMLEVPEMQNDLAKAGAAVNAAQADVAAARDGLNRASASFDLAQLSYTRLAEVSNREPGLVPQQDVDVAHAHNLEAEAQLASAKSALTAAEERAKEAVADRQRVQTMADYTAIRA